MEPEPKKKRYRIQLDMTERTFRDLNRLKDRLGTVTNAETMRYAVNVTLSIFDEIDKGQELSFESEKGIKKMVLPFL